MRRAQDGRKGKYAGGAANQQRLPGVVAVHLAGPRGGAMCLTGGLLTTTEPAEVTCPECRKAARTRREWLERTAREGLAGRSLVRGGDRRARQRGLPFGTPDGTQETGARNGGPR